MTRKRVSKEEKQQRHEWVMNQKNPGAEVSAIRQLDHMTGVGYNSHRGCGARR